MNLATAKALRAAGQHEEARAALLLLAEGNPQDALLQYELACVHDYLGLEAQAIPFYLAALNGQLPAEARRGAITGLGSTYRTLGRYAEAQQTLEEGLAQFPLAQEMSVFLAMVHFNLGQHRQAVETLLRLLAQTSSDAGIRAYAKAIEFYAKDIEQVWPESDGK